MARFISRLKHIACLESLWDHDIESAKLLTLTPVLDLISKIHPIKYSRLTCNTLEELKFSLGLLRKKTSYLILYLAFHGGKGSISLGDKTTVNLDELAEMMGLDFQDRVIFFASCDTIKTDEAQILDFINQTNVAMVIGYASLINHIEGAAMELLVFQELQNYVDIPSFENRVLTTYSDLIEITGLKIYSKRS